MDDALALFYLIGRPREAEVLAVTCTFGNGTTEQVYRASRDLLSEAGWERLPVICGASQGEDPVSDAARFIVEETRKKAGRDFLCGHWLSDESVWGQPPGPGDL